MAILLDSIGHLVSTTSIEELHTFAQGIGLKRSWFQGQTPVHPHYDITTSRAMGRAIAHGAILIDPATLVRALRAAPYIAAIRAAPPHLSPTDRMEPV